MKLLHLAVGLSVAAGLLLSPSLADADQHKYMGAHPIHASHGGKFCYIEFPHVHMYAPTNAAIIYRKKNGWHQFVGDPVAHGFDGKKHTFHGAHPIHRHEVVLGAPAADSPVVHWCFLKGPHFHAFAPSARAKFKVTGGAAFFVGVYPPVFHKHKHRHVRINRFYARRKYRRPIITITPPSAYVDILVVGRGKRGRRGHIRAGVGVRLKVPKVKLRIGGHKGKIKLKRHRKGRHYVKPKRKGRYQFKRKHR